MCIRDSFFPLFYSFPPPLEVTTPIAARGSWGSAQAPPAGPGRARPPSALWRILGLSLRFFEYLMQLTDTRNHTGYWKNFNMTGQIRWGTLHSVPHGARFRWGTRLNASMAPPPMLCCNCSVCYNKSHWVLPRRSLLPFYNSQANRIYIMLGIIQCIYRSSVKNAKRK